MWNDGVMNEELGMVMEEMVGWMGNEEVDGGGEDV